MSDYDLDVVQIGDIVRLEVKTGTIEGKVTGHHEIVGEDVMRIEIRESENVRYAYHYTEKDIGTDVYEIELVRWDDD